MLRARAFVVVASTLLALAGCSSSSSGGDSTGGGAGSGPTASQTYTQSIKAADGGMVTAPGVAASIPPGALSADTTITVTVSDASQAPDASNVGSQVFDFGPNGTTFAMPVELSIDFAGTVPSGKKAVIAFLKDGAWVPLDDSSVSGGKIVAHTTHFTPFAVYYTSGQGQTGGTQCPAFTACGGDLTGTWTFTAACMQVGPNSDPFMGQCPGATLAATVDFKGMITFNADMSYTENHTLDLSYTINVDKTCSKLNGTCPSNNSTITWTDNGTTCTGTGSQPTDTNMETGTWATSGTSFTTTKTGSTAGSPIDYCVMGNMLTARQLDKNGNTVYYSATK